MGKIYQKQNGALVDVTPSIVATVPDASTSVKGIVQLDSEISSSATKVVPSGVLATEFAKYPLIVNNLYVDGTNGDDANDGLTAATAVKTLATGIVRARNYHLYAGTVLHVAEGTYDESLYVDCFVGLRLNGDVTISSLAIATVYGQVGISTESGVTSTLTITALLESRRGGSFTVSAGIDVTVGRISAANNGYIEFYGQTITVGSDDISGGYLISCVIGSEIVFNGCTINLVGKAGKSGIRSAYASTLQSGNSTFNFSVAGDKAICADHTAAITIDAVNITGTWTYAVHAFSTGTIQLGAVAATNFTFNRFAFVEYSSNIAFVSTVNLNGVFTDTVCYAHQNAFVVFVGAITITKTNDSSVRVLFAALRNACIHIQGNLTATGKFLTFYYSEMNSIVIVENSSNILNGTVTTATVASVDSSSVLIRNAAAFSGTVTGKKYDLRRGSSISGDASKITGSQAGTLDTASYCFVAAIS